MKFSLTLICCLLLNSLVAQDLEQGLIGHWLMNDEDEMEDESVNDQTGYIDGAEFTTNRFGLEEEALIFDGIDDYVVLDDVLDEVYTEADGAFSVSLWHRTGDAIPNLSPLICKYAHSGCGDLDRQWALLIAANEGIRFYYASTPDNVNYRSISTLNAVAQEPQTWYHIVVNYDGSIDTNDGQDRVQIYLDNVLQEDTLNFTIGELGESITDGEAPLGLMGYVSTSSTQCGEYNVPGALDDLRIYDRVLLESEVNLLYLEGVVGIDEQEEFSNAISLYPSVLTNQEFTIHTAKDVGKLQLDIFSNIGELMQSMTVTSVVGNQSISLHGLAAGNYLVKLRSVEGWEHTERLVIQ